MIQMNNKTQNGRLRIQNDARTDLQCGRKLYPFYFLNNSVKRKLMLQIRVMKVLKGRKEWGRK